MKAKIIVAFLIFFINSAYAGINIANDTGHNLHLRIGSISYENIPPYSERGYSWSPFMFSDSKGKLIKGRVDVINADPFSKRNYGWFTAKVTIINIPFWPFLTGNVYDTSGFYGYGCAPTIVHANCTFHIT